MRRARTPASRRWRRTRTALPREEDVAAVIRVGVIGAAGRMGRLVCAAVSSDPDLDLVAGIVRPGAEIPSDLSGLPLADSLDALRGAGAEVAVDFTRPDAVMGNLRWAIGHGVHMVVGTTGLS